MLLKSFWRWETKSSWVKKKELLNNAKIINAKLLNKVSLFLGKRVFLQWSCDNLTDSKKILWISLLGKVAKNVILETFDIFPTGLATTAALKSCLK